MAVLDEYAAGSTPGGPLAPIRAGLGSNYGVFQNYMGGQGSPRLADLRSSFRGFTPTPTTGGPSGVLGDVRRNLGVEGWDRFRNALGGPGSAQMRALRGSLRGANMAAASPGASAPGAPAAGAADWSSSFYIPEEGQGEGAMRGLRLSLNERYGPGGFQRWRTGLNPGTFDSLRDRFNQLRGGTYVTPTPGAKRFSYVGAQPAQPWSTLWNSQAIQSALNPNAPSPSPVM